jgi:hypothetical protein
MTALTSSAVDSGRFGDVGVHSAAVVSADAQELGYVDGFLVDGNEWITHFVLESTSAFGLRSVAIPLGAVARIATGSVTLGLTAEDVRRLPEVVLGHRTRTFSKLAPGFRRT